MTTLVSKWGHSLAVRIPKSVAAAVNVSDGDAVEVTVHAGTIIVRPQARRYAIEDLVQGITAKNRHDADDWGAPVGRETW